MHEPVSQFARGGEYQQATGIEVQPPHGQPFGAADDRQFLEHAAPALRIVATDDLAVALVIDDDSRQARGDLEFDLAASDLDHVLGRHAHAENGRLAVDLDLAGLDDFFHGAPRTEPGLREHFLQLL